MQMYLTMRTAMTLVVSFVDRMIFARIELSSTKIAVISSDGVINKSADWNTPHDFILVLSIYWQLLFDNNYILSSVTWAFHEPEIVAVLNFVIDF